MSIVPFKGQYLHLLKPPYNSQYVEGYLNGTNAISRYIIDQEFNLFIAGFHPLLHLNPSVRKELENSKSLYKKFNTIRNFKHIWKKHPYVAALLKAKIKSNKSFIASILERLQQDEHLLRNRFKMINFKVENLEINKGDVHNNGKTTAIITFENDLKLVYKPRSAGLDIAFGKVLQTFNAFYKKLPLKSINIIDRDQYSWCEFVTQDSCSAIKEIKEYYHKAGVLLALMYVLRGVDIHFENIIAHGTDPVIIDVECLFHNSTVDYFNVLNTGMCPVLSLNGYQNSAVDLSGLGANGVIKLDRKEWKWSHVEKDALNLEPVIGFIKASGNMPVYRGEIITPGKYVKQILQGFDAVFSWIETIQKKIKASEPHIFEVFQNQIFRIIPRITQDYTDILNNSFTPQAIQSVHTRKESIQKDLENFNFTLPYLSKEEKEKVLKAELAAIERMDIPHFTGNTTDFYIKESDKCILKNYFQKTPYQSIIEHIMRLDQEQTISQKNLIQSSLASRYNLKLSKKSDPDSSTQETPAINYQQQLDQIAAKIQSSSFFQYDQINWSTFIEENGTQVFSLLNITLYSGKLGIAIFLSNLSRHKATATYNITIEAIVDDAITYFKNQKEEVDLSYASGISGLIHALIEIDPDGYRDVMLEFSSRITKEVIEKDTVLDYLGGVAGCLSVFCALYKVTNSERVLSQCQEIGYHLLHKRVVDPVSQYKCWISSSISMPLTGYSHGAAGIGLALLQLYEISPSDHFKDAFYEAIAFENHYYEDEQNNWKDLRSASNSFQNSWCHGAAGIGLARVEAYRILKDPVLLIDIKNAVTATIRETPADLDHYCCGNAGRLHFLMESTTLIKHKELIPTIQKQMNELLTKQNKNSYFLTQTNPHISIENPSLYRGTSGIGQLLISYDQFLETHHLKPQSSS